MLSELERGPIDVTFDRHPHLIGHHLARVGDVQECKCDDGGIEYVTAKATKNLATKHDPKGHTECRQPQRHRWRQHKGDHQRNGNYAGPHPATLDPGEQPGPEAPGSDHRQEGGNKVDRAMDDGRPGHRGIVASAEKIDERLAPARRCVDAETRHCKVGLISRVVDGHQGRWNKRHHEDVHGRAHVHPISHMRCGAGHRGQVYEDVNPRHQSSLSICVSTWRNIAP